MKKIFNLSLLLLVALALLLPQSMSATAKKILVVGNSFSYDAALQEFAPIVASGGDEITLGFPYKGGTTLQLHDERIQSGEVIYNYYKLTVNSSGTASQTTTGSNSKAFDASIVGDEAWDVVIIQTDHNYSCAYDHYFPYLNNIITFIKNNLQSGANPEFYLYMTWAYQDGSSKINELINLGLCTDQADQYTKIVDCAFRAAEASGIGTANVIPGGTAVQNGRTSYIGDNYNRDGYHMNYNYGRYTVALTWYEKIFGKSALDVTYHPATISDYCAEMCRNAAHAAITTPKSVTSLAADFGENRDDLQASLTRSLLINFTTPELTADGWNNLTSIAQGTSIADLTAQDGTASGVSATISDAFAGTTTGGATSTTAALEMPQNVSSTGFWVNGVTKNGVLDNTGAITFGGLDSSKTYDFVLFGSQLSDTESYETEFSAGVNEDFIDLTTSNNTRQTVTLANIAPDASGNITLKVTPGATSTDTYKMGYVNALALVMPFVPSYTDPWDGQTTSEPTKNASGQYVIYCGAELAWIASYVNAGNNDVSFILANDIDLGSQKFTPIGYGAAFNGKIDGQGYAINNLLIDLGDGMDSSNKFAGLVGYTSSTSCDIENLTVRGTINMSSTANSNVGGIIGKANALGNVRNCRSEVNINVNSAYNGYCGGIIGMGKTMNLENCVYAGTITIGSAGRVQKGVGGIIGTTNSTAEGQEATIQGCAFIGTIVNQGTKTSSYTAGINGYSNLTKGSETETSNYVYGTISNTATNLDLFCGKSSTTNNFSVTNCYYLSTMTASTNGTAATADQFHSGEVAYLLNGDGTYMYFGQDLSDSNSLPEPYTETNRVYRTTLMSDGTVSSTLYNNSTLALPAGTWYDAEGNEYKSGDATDKDLTLYDTNPNAALFQDPWNGSSMLEPATNGDGYYIITCGAELAWVANDVNSGNKTDCFILANDIDLGNQPFTPIGYNAEFNGKADGQGYAINNLNIVASDLDTSKKLAALISYTNSADCEVKNFTLHGTITMTSTAGSNVASLIGKANNIGKISNCSSDMSININSVYSGYCGGILGQGKAIAMESCYYSGTITIAADAKVGKGVGGLVGTTNTNTKNGVATITGSAFTGKIVNNGSNASSYTGGIISYARLYGEGAVETDSRNYVYGSIANTATDLDIFTGKNGCTSYTISDCYYLDTMGSSDNGTAATAEQFHSGEVAYKLNSGLETPLYGQNLSSDSSLPEAYNTDNHVFSTTFMVGGSVYAVLYNNSTVKFPADPETAEGDTFENWVDSEGTVYSSGSTTHSDLVLYADISTGIDLINADAKADDDLYDLLGRKVTTDRPVHGVYIRGGKKVLF